MDHTKKELYTAKRSSGVDLSDSSITETWAKVRADDQPENWMLFSVGAGNKVVLNASGAAGFDEMVGNMNDADLQFGVIRVTCQNMVKFIGFYFVGSTATAMKKGKALLYRDAVFASIEVHGQVTFLDGLAEVSREKFADDAGRALHLNKANLSF